MASGEPPRAPYAPASAVLKCLDGLRDNRIADELTGRALVNVGVAKGNVPRTIAALRFLGMATDGGRLTALGKELVTVPQSGYRQLLARVVRRSYQLVFERCDPRSSSRTTLLDAFRQYRPAKKRGEMVTLFVGLCRETGIIAGAPANRRDRPEKTASVSLEPAPAYGEVLSDEPGMQVLNDLVRDLPRTRRWTERQKQTWLAAFVAVLDFLVEVEQGQQERQLGSSEEAPALPLRTAS